MYLIDLQRQLMFIYSKVLFETLSQCIGKDRIGETIHSGMIFPNIRKPVSRVLGNTLALNCIELKSKQKFKNLFSSRIYTNFDICAKIIAKERSLPLLPTQVEMHFCLQGILALSNKLQKLEDALGEMKDIYEINLTFSQVISILNEIYISAQSQWFQSIRLHQSQFNEGE